MYGQNPGKQEEASAERGEFGRVFIGDAGRELWEHYCALAGIVRGEDVYIGNVMSCHTENDRKPSPREITTCAAFHMPRELTEHDPEIVVLMGAPACSIVPSFWLEAHHGYPFKVDLFGTRRWTVPMYHPAAGLHDPALMTEMIQDWERLRKILGGDLSTPIDEYPNPDYRDLTGDHEAIEFYSQASRVPESDRFMARDTEYLQAKKSPHKKPWCSTFSVLRGEGYMVRATDREGLQILGRNMQGFYGILHNALADLDVEKALGLPECEFDDTMQLAAHQQDLPQKLKALAWRLAGMTMKDYEDVVMPYSRTAVMEWLEAAYDVAVMTPTIKTKYTSKKRKMPRTEKAMQKLWAEIGAFNPAEKPDGYFHFKIAEQEECDSDLTKKILHIHKHTAKPVPADADKPYNPWEAWQKQVVVGLGPEIENEVVKRIGPMPQASIQEVFTRNPQEAIRYACLGGKSLIDTDRGLIRIQDIVNHKMRVKVRSFDTKSKKIVSRGVTGWIRNSVFDEGKRWSTQKRIKWFSVVTEHTLRGRFGKRATRYTADHRVLTPSGYKRVDSLRSGDEIYLPNEKMSTTERQITLGSILGDGYIAQRYSGGSACLLVSHCKAQLPYLKWKKSQLPSLFPKTHVVKDRHLCVGGKSTTKTGFTTLATAHHPELLILRRDSYRGHRGKKNLGKWIYEIEPLALAIWYQDDGSIVGTESQQRCPRFYTLGFKKAEVELLLVMLRERFGLIGSMFEMKREGRNGEWALALGVESADAFFEMIAPYVHPSMDYKLPKEWRGKFAGDLEHDVHGLCTSRVLKVVSNPAPSGSRGELCYSYCIDVEDTHNFLTQYEVAHNCRDSDSTRRIYPVLKERSHKYDGRVMLGDIDR